MYCAFIICNCAIPRFVNISGVVIVGDMAVIVGDMVGAGPVVGDIVGDMVGDILITAGVGEDTLRDVDLFLLLFFFLLRPVGLIFSWAIASANISLASSTPSIRS